MKKTYLAFIFLLLFTVASAQERVVLTEQVVPDDSIEQLDCPFVIVCDCFYDPVADQYVCVMSVKRDCSGIE